MKKTNNISTLIPNLWRPSPFGRCFLLSYFFPDVKFFQGVMTQGTCKNTVRKDSYNGESLLWNHTPARYHVSLYSTAPNIAQLRFWDENVTISDYANLRDRYRKIILTENTALDSWDQPCPVRIGVGHWNLEFQWTLVLEPWGFGRIEKQETLDGINFTAD